MIAAQHEQLWRRIEAFQLDDPQAALPFSMRLAKENGWSRRFARRVTDEYKRFLFLARVADHVACPSDEVDQAWHLHLTYTRSYWDDLCTCVLRQPLHHGPTRGGREEHEKYFRLYQRTLDSYREFFGDDPPPDIWPAPEQRFGSDRDLRRVDLRRNWIVPKWRWLWRPGGFLSRHRALPLLVVPSAFSVVSPFDISGPAFLLFYVVCYLGALVLALVVRRAYLTGDGDTAGEELDVYQIAVLAENERLAVNAAITKLVQSGALRINTAKQKTLWGLSSTETYTFDAADETPPDASPLEVAIWQAARRHPDATFGMLHAAGADEARDIALGLEERGLLATVENQSGARIFPALIMSALLVLAFIKVAVGLSRDKPVLFLVGFCVVTIVTLILLMRNTRLTDAGREVLRRTRRRMSGLRHARLEPAADSAPETAALAVALFGATALAGSPLENLRLAWTQHFRSSHGYIGSSGGCGGGDGCGGGGCGGGGCGGCGGCGG